MLCNRATLLFWKVNFLPRCVDLGFKLKHTCVSHTLCPALSLSLYGRGVNDNSGLLISPLNLLIYHWIHWQWLAVFALTFKWNLPEYDIHFYFLSKIHKLSDFQYILNLKTKEEGWRKKEADVYLAVHTNNTLLSWLHFILLNKLNLYEQSVRLMIIYWYECI